MVQNMENIHFDTIFTVTKDRPDGLYKHWIYADKITQ